MSDEQEKGEKRVEGEPTEADLDEILDEVVDDDISKPKVDKFGDLALGLSQELRDHRNASQLDHPRGSITEKHLASSLRDQIDSTVDFRRAVEKDDDAGTITFPDHDVIISKSLNVNEGLDVGDEIKHVGSYIIPLGMVYIQFPGEDEPGDLFPGTWEDVSGDFGGEFFRAEGGDSSDFNTGSQNDQIQNVYGRVYGRLGNRSGSSYSHAFYFYDSGEAERTGDGSSSGGMDLRFSASRDARTGSETRPTNVTIRVFKRTA